jgi:hypothetical protein
MSLHAIALTAAPPQGLILLASLAKVRLLDDIVQRLNTVGWSHERLVAQPSQRFGSKMIEPWGPPRRHLCGRQDVI